eukprot:5996721-Alexandrium_andersonii.AAC.1
MSASLVGSEMCIRDRFSALSMAWPRVLVCFSMLLAQRGAFGHPRLPRKTCLLYTSDAADDM